MSRINIRDFFKSPDRDIARQFRFCVTKRHGERGTFSLTFLHSTGRLSCKIKPLSTRGCKKAARLRALFSLSLDEVRFSWEERTWNLRRLFGARAPCLRRCRWKTRASGIERKGTGREKETKKELLHGLFSPQHISFLRDFPPLPRGGRRYPRFSFLGL